MTLEYASEDAVKARVKWSDSASERDQTVLDGIRGAANDYIEFFIGCAVGPSAATSLTLDGRLAEHGGAMLKVPMGIRTITSLAIDGTTVDLAKVFLRPVFPLPGWPFQQIWLDGPLFTNGFANVVPVGAFGFAAIPASLTEVGELVTARAWYAHQAGQKDMLGTDEQGRALISRFVSARDRETLIEYRDRIGIKKRAVSVEMSG